MAVYYQESGLDNTDVDLYRATVGCPEIGTLASYKLLNSPAVVSKIDDQADILNDRYNIAGLSPWERLATTGA